LRRALDRGGFDLFLGETVPEPWQPLLNLRASERTSSPVAIFGAGWDRFLGSRSSNLRAQVRARERRLRAAHDVEFRLVSDAATLAADLATLFRLHRLRWPASPFFADLEAFHREFAAVALERGWLRLWLLELDGRPAAAWLGYRFAGVESYYQAGRDPAFERESVGFVLLAQTLRAAAEDGVDEYRFLRGAEPFKFRFSTGDVPVQTLVQARGIRGWTAFGARGAKRLVSEHAPRRT
jgi:CelD/BcsL family acetyltransferase involved in cellulose biosynthesis